MKQVGIVAMVLAVGFLVVCQSVALAQNLGAAPQVNVAVQGQTGAAGRCLPESLSTGSAT